VTGVLDHIEISDRPSYRLPPEAYFDAGWYALERKELFGNTWNLIGHESHLAKPGDFISATVGADPVVVVRGNDVALHGYLNLCRHRGMAIVCGTGSCGESLRCGYHGWEFSLDEGALQRVPQRKAQFPDLDAGSLGLFEVSVATWGGFVFVHPDPAAASTFDGWLGDFPERMGEYPWDELIEVGRATVPLACNWKLYIENHIDWLHLWYLHQETLKQYEHHEASYDTTGLHWCSAETLRAGEPFYEPAGVRPIPGVSDEERNTLRANLIFPNVPVACMGNIVQTYAVIPTGPESCELDIRSYGTRGSVITEQTRNEGLLVLRDEDGVACEQMQVAMHSPRFEVGPLAIDHERPIADFHRNILTFLGSHAGHSSST
jgi:phenylpropionate dioxygenase-like ring-hydroxylating dioxygenase large terminal subunit